MHRLLLPLHRYVGLALAAFLVVIGLSGGITAFFPDLDPWLNRGLYKVEPEGAPRAAIDLFLEIRKADPDAHIFAFHYPKDPTGTLSAYAEGAIDPANGKAKDIAYDQLFANPYTGAIVGKRFWGDLPFERKDVFTFIYFLHYSLVLPEFLGEVFMGIVALVWAFDCVIGLLLTFPRRSGDARRAAGFWRGWGRAWRVQWQAGTNRLIFDWHRAASLWVWAMLLVFAVSGFSFNLPTVYTTLLARVSGYVDTEVHPELAAPLLDPAIGWREAERLGQTYMADAAQTRGFSIVRPYGLTYRREKGIYIYRIVSSRDLTIYGDTSVSFDAATGKLIGVTVSTGDNAANTFTSWIKALHQGTVFGLPYRFFVGLMGLVVASLAVSGVLIWYRKYAARKARTVRADM